MTEGNCTGLHPYGPCSPGEGCNAPADPVGLRVAELEAELREERESHAATWKRAGENGRLLIESRARVAELDDENLRLREQAGDMAETIERLTRERDIYAERERQALVVARAIGEAGRFGRIG